MEERVSEKPARLAVGQRWRDKTDGHVYRVTDINERGLAVVTWESAPGGEVPQLGSHTFAHADYSLVDAIPTAPPAVRAGQRRRWKDATPDADHEFTVAASPRGGFFADFGEAGCSANFSREFFERESTLITDAPAPPEVVPRCETCGSGPGDHFPCECKPAPAAPPLREVSTNGRDWIDYNRLTDADAFDAYRHRRIDGVLQAVAVEAPRVRVVGTYNGHREVKYGIERTVAEATKGRTPRPTGPALPTCLTGPNPPAERAYWRRSRP